MSAPAQAGSAASLRRQADREQLERLASRSDGRLVIDSWADRPGRPLRVTLACRTVGDARFPQTAEAVIRLRIDLPARYPFERPVITVETPIFHPNVFPNGTVCQGEKWLPGDAMDIVIKRLIRLLTFEADHVNPASPANAPAANWYRGQLRQRAGLFPTDRLRLDESRVLLRCPACQAGLRLPSGRRGVVACPRCQHEFDART